MRRQKRPAWAIRALIVAGDAIAVGPGGAVRFARPTVEWICKPAGMRAFKARRRAPP